MTLACIYPHAKAQVKNVNLTDTVKVNALLQQFKETVGESQDKSFGYAREAKEISEKLNYKKGLAAALKSMGIARYYAGKNLQAVDYWQQSIKVFESINDNTGVANILSNIGAIYFDQGEDDKALDYYLRSLKIAEQLDDKLRIATALNNVGGVYANKKATYNKALPYFLNALSLAEESGDKEAIRTTTSNLGEVYALLGKDTLALKYYNKSLKIGGIRKAVHIPTTWLANSMLSGVIMKRRSIITIGHIILRKNLMDSSTSFSHLKEKEAVISRCIIIRLPSHRMLKQKQLLTR